jgi:galactose oxidase
VLGKWGPTIEFPIVPVGAFVDPLSGNVITFSSNEHRGFGNANPNGVTFTATWDFASKKVVSQARVDKTEHDMFCPGMAFDVNGRMVITGGKTQKKTSVYDPKSVLQEPWKRLAQMTRSRGYHGSTTASNGNIFVIGGSWSLQNANTGGRDGEMYDPTSDKWSPLGNCHGKDIQMTEDWEDIKLHSSYRSDNHVWLLGWKNNTIFHAGPAKDMHWITTTNSGAIKPASRRSNDRDAMCGSAVMYNATEGKILTMGGAPNYRYFDNSDPSNIKEAGQKASRNAFIITLGNINAPVSVEKAGDNMSFNRTFHHAVVLPTGETFVVGGQLIGEGFTDQTPVLDPEIYSPVGNQWRTVAPHSIVRVYHSFALLLPDATVLVGGGGLCGDCGVNHPDAQIYTPAYLLESRGGLATRPVITDWPATAPAVLPGATLTITTDTDVVSASLIRYGGATHSLNNDQRRIELKLVTKTARQYTAALPDNGGIAIPGYYMLFVINPDGVPSVAKNVQILVGKN